AEYHESEKEKARPWACQTDNHVLPAGLHPPGRDRQAAEPVKHDLPFDAERAGRDDVAHLVNQDGHENARNQNDRVLDAEPQRALAEHHRHEPKHRMNANGDADQSEIEVELAPAGIGEHGAAPWQVRRRILAARRTASNGISSRGRVCCASWTGARSAMK